MAKTAQIQLHSGPWGSCGTNGSLRVTWHKLRECCLGIGPKSLSRPLKQSQNPYGNQERTSTIYTFNHLSSWIQYIPWRHANIGSFFYYVPVPQHLDTCYYNTCHWPCAVQDWLEHRWNCLMRLRFRGPASFQARKLCRDTCTSPATLQCDMLPHHQSRSWTPCLSSQNATNREFPSCIPWLYVIGSQKLATYNKQTKNVSDYNASSMLQIDTTHIYI